MTKTAFLARPSTIAAAISATEKKIAGGYDKPWRYAENYVHHHIDNTLSAIRRDELIILEKLKSLQAG